MLAREVTVQAPTAHDAAAVFGVLRAGFESCYVFCAGRGDAAFVAASPELLIRRDGHRAQTVALAGSTRRSADPAVDDHLGEQLLRSDKDREEQAIVVRRIARALRPHAVWVAAPDEPALIKVANIQHLATPIRAQLAHPLSAIELAGLLHPTPAVGGEPHALAAPQIPVLEGIDRGWYAGAVGWTDANDDGEFCVALRCALLRGREARLYAGVGVVRDSDPVSELNETEIKLGALLPILAGSAQGLGDPGRSWVPRLLLGLWPCVSLHSMFRREDGQTSAEYLGALVLVMVIVFAVIASDAPADVVSGMRKAICKIGAGTDCGQPNRSGGYADDPYEDSGEADREIYDANCGSTPDDPEREGDDGAVGDDQVDKAYENLGRVYDYYHDTFGWDSYDGKGAPMVGIVNVCDGGTSSYWSDDTVHFAPGAGDALDTAAHEFTHGITENTAGLRYECQSGALNESISDIMAWNLDPSDPTYGEDRNGDGPTIPTAARSATTSSPPASTSR